MTMKHFIIAATTISMAAGQSIFDPIIAKGSYSTLLDAINTTGSAAIIEASAPVTIFGPKDSAFDAISETVANLTTEELAGILANHVIAGANYTAADVVAAGCVEVDTLGGLKLGINYNPATGAVTVNGVTVSDVDIAGDYGVLHGIDEVLPGGFVPCIPKILKPIEAKGTYNILLEAVVRADIVPDIAANLPVTIFGPKDSAFIAIAETISGLSEQEVKAILLNHVVADANVTAGAVVAAGCLEVPTVGGLMLGVHFDPDTSAVTVNNVTVSDFDISGDYGILHGLEEVLLGDFVPCPLFEADFTPIADKGNYTTLLGALGISGGDAAISANAPVTIFGPKDSAFAAIQETVDGLSPDDLLAVLLNHVVVDVAVDAKTVTTLKCVEATTAGGMDIAVRYNETTDVVDINGVVIDDFDITGDYGIMHGMNAVLLGNETFEPCPIPDLVDQIAFEGNYNTLLGLLLGKPQLLEDLDDIGSITIFGPDDDAFAAVDLSGLTEDEVTSTLAGHVVEGVYTAADVKAAGCVILDTLGGTKIRAMYMEGDDHHDHDHRRKLAGHGDTDDHGDHDDHHEDLIMINDAHVIVADIADETSIFHGLDEVLLPGGEELACPTEAPVAAPTVAPAPIPADEEGKKEESSASISSFSLAAIAAVAAFAF